VTYEKRGNRISLLPITRYCGYAADLSEKHGAGRAAAMSSAFHAKLADPSGADTKRKLLSLNEREQQDIATWNPPGDAIVFGDSISYADSEKELPVGLDDDGNYVESGHCLTAGTLDMGWVRRDLAIVGDIKKERFTVESPDTLQLQAYAWAYARKNGLSKFLTGIWVATDGEWIWSDRIIDMDSFEGLEIWETIKHAANQTGVAPSPGEHCRSCYGRLHCGEHLAPAAFAESWLAPATRGELEPEALVKMLVTAERIEALIDKVKEHAKEAVLRGAVLKHPTTGKVYRSTTCEGRASFNVAALAADHPELVKLYMRRGNPYHRFTWGKP
jgi:hypothetical protein